MLTLTLAFFKTLYTIERRLKRRGASADERYRARQAESVPALEKLHQWSSDLRPKVAPDTKLGIALNYLNNQWPTLIAYCEDGRYHIDNNVAENAIRPFCVGRKNYLFSDTPAGARASATLYSIIETAKACQLEPYAYLRHVLTELPKAQCVNDIELLLPSKVDANLPRLSA